MKVNIYETVEVSDDARKRIAAALGQKTVTRDEMKVFIWEQGADWEARLEAWGDTAQEKSNVQVAEELIADAFNGDLEAGAPEEEEDLI